MLKINTIVNQNKKFTTASFGCFLRLPLTKHNLAFVSLLARLQMNASLQYPTISSQQEVLSNLYDLQFEVVPQLFGREIILSYLVNFIEPVTLLDPDYTYEKIADVLADIIQHPSFDKNLVTFTQKQLLADYQELMEEPANLALDRFFRLWYRDSPDYAENFMGPIDEIKAATPTDLQRFSFNLREMPMTIIAFARDSSSFERLIKNKFKQAGLLKNFACDDLSIAASKLDLHKEEQKQTLQAQLLIGYGYREKCDFKAQIAGMLLAQYLTGDPSSKLFAKIRENLGAAYDVEANNYANNSLFLIAAGMDPKQVKEAQAIIEQEVAAVADGQIDDQLFKKSKKALLTIQTVGLDQENWQLAQALRKELFSGYTDFDRVQAIKKLSKYQLKKFAQNLFLNESYVLK